MFFTNFYFATRTFVAREAKVWGGEVKMQKEHLEIYKNIKH